MVPEAPAPFLYISMNNSIELTFDGNSSTISTNLLVVYRESVNLIGYITRRLSADSLQLKIANENRLFSTRDAFFTPQYTSRAVFETFELPM